MMLVESFDATKRMPEQHRHAAMLKGSGLLPRRVIFGNPERCVVRISPDGARIAFLAPVDGVLNLWVAPIDQIDDARPATAVTDRSAADASIASVSMKRSSPVSRSRAASPRRAKLRKSSTSMGTTGWAMPFNVIGSSGRARTMSRTSMKVS